MKRGMDTQDLVADFSHHLVADISHQHWHGSQEDGNRRNVMKLDGILLFFKLDPHLFQLVSESPAWDFQQMCGLQDIYTTFFQRGIN